MTAGRKPKPTALKQLEGNPGKRKLPTEEPKLAPALPSPPKELTAAAKREWKRVGPELFAAGILTNADRAALAAYCQSWADWVTARANLDKDGWTKLSETGYEMQSPWVSIANRAMANYIKVAAEFGLTPSARARLATDPRVVDPEDEKAKELMDS